MPTTLSLKQELNAVPKLLLHYGKGGTLKYLSHLELARALERSFRRAGIEVNVSGGFNPRPKISYGPALPVGTSSSVEYLVADVKECVAEREIIERISRTLPKGLCVYGAKYIPQKHASLMSVVQAVAYRVAIEAGVATSGLSEYVERLLREEQLLVRHKGSEKWVETKVSILGWEVEETSAKTAVFSMVLSAGDRNSVRPEVLIAKLAEMTPELGGIEAVGIDRIGQYVNRENPLHDIYNFYESVTMGSECAKS